ncbi:MAG: hypothetical protein MUP85_18725 [Candidatus Lokiarchaeota archaeon]|nr:hypothetical protein [Candidatus Lokiarchaeota archaeon]
MRCLKIKRINLEIIRKNYWLITLVSALMVYVSVLVPSWSGIEDSIFINAWYWGFYIWKGKWDVLESELMSPGIIVSIILLFGATVILFSALSSKRKGDNKPIFSLIGGIVSIIAPIIFMISMFVVYDEFWAHYFPTFGLILPFIGGSLAIVGWYSIKRS